MECIIAMAIGLVVVVILIFIRQRLNPSPPISQEQFKYQAKSFDEIIKKDPKLKDFVMEAKQEGATHIADEGTISFYRSHEEKYERRFLEYSPSGYWFWISNWRKCKELPEYALTIPEAI